MKRRELLDQCEELIKSYNPKRTTLEAHALEFLGSMAATPDGAFVREVLYGVMRCKAALKVFMTCFFNDLSARVLRSDYTMYMIFAYLSVFRLSELTVEEFRKFVGAVDPDKMVNFLEYIFNASTLEASGVVSQWTKIFDPEYVHETLLARLTAARPEMDRTVAELKAKSIGLAAALLASEEQKGPAKRAATVAVAPTLTKPAPRRVPEPARISQHRANPTRRTRSRGDPGGSGSGSGGDEDDEERARATLRQPESSSRSFVDSPRGGGGGGGGAITFHDENEMHETMRSSAAESRRGGATSATKRSLTKTVGMRLHSTRSTVTVAARDRESKEASSLKFEEGSTGSLPRARPAPPRPTAAVKLNAAAILREDALFRAKQELEAAKIEAYEAELRDSSEFFRWQQGARARDARARLEQISRTRALAKASAEEAAFAKQHKFDDNRELAHRGQSESDAMAWQRKLENGAYLERNRERVGEVRETRETAPKEAAAELLARNQNTRLEVHEDFARRLALKKLEDEERAALLAERVKQLKADCAVHAENLSQFDPTDTIGLGLLDEMSLVEMQERLAVNKRREEEKRDDKAQAIAKAKAAQRADLRARAENIATVRTAAATQNSRAKDLKAAQAARLADAAKEDEERLLLGLVKELERKREESDKRRAKLAADDERRKKDKLFAGKSEHADERTRAKQILQGAERMAKSGQRRLLEETATYETTRAGERQQLATNARRADVSHKRDQQHNDAAVRAAQREMLQSQKADMADKKKHYADAKRSHKQTMQTIIDPYAASINATSVQRARRHAQLLDATRASSSR